jgi:hypothetical protein
VLVLYGISIVFTSLSMLLIFNKDLQAFLIITVFSIVVFVLITKLGYMEMFYSRFRTKKSNRLEAQLEDLILEKVSKNIDEDDLFKTLPIKGFQIINEKGEITHEKGDKDKTNFIDISSENETCVRFFWNANVPTINTKEATMLSILTKSILKNWVKPEKK